MKNSKTLLFKIILSLSCFYLSIFLSNMIDITSFITLLQFIFSFVVIFKIYKSIKLNKRLLIISIFIALYFIKIYFPFNNNLITTFNYWIFSTFHVTDKGYLLMILLSIISLPSLIYFIYRLLILIIPFVKRFFKRLTNVEKKYLLIYTIIGCILCIILSYMTTSFSLPIHKGNDVLYDVIYTADNGYLSKYNSWLNINCAENDLRQPLFALFSLPFSIIASFISNFVFFTRKGYEYYTIMQIIQFFLLALSTIMISRIFKINNKNKKYFFLMSSVSYPYVLFSLLLEQYIISFFYLILTIYYYFYSKKDNYFYVAATGTILTSGILFPLTFRKDNIKHWLKNCINCLLIFLTLMVIIGKINLLEEYSSYKNFYAEFASSKIDNINKYTVYVKDIFFVSKGTVSYQPRSFGKINQYRYISKIQKKTSLIGVIIIILSTISIVINYKDKRIIIAYLWILFTFIILGIIGWGAYENGFILYSLYFGWAYIIMIYKLLEKLIKNKKLFNSIILLLIITMAFFNIKEFINIIIFSVKYY